MDYRRLAGTDLDLSVITFGTITFAPGPAGGWRRDFEAGQKALHQALDSGINCIHSAFEYETRWAIRRVLRERSDRKDIKHIIKWPNPDERCTRNKLEPMLQELLLDLCQRKNGRWEPSAEEYQVKGVARIGPHTHREQ